MLPIASNIANDFVSNYGVGSDWMTDIFEALVAESAWRKPDACLSGAVALDHENGLPREKM